MGAIALKDEVENLISHIKHEANPLIVANKISYFLSDALREGKVSLHEAYMLNWEEIKYRKMGYTQSAWNGRVRIATCLTILNQKLLAHIFDEQAGAEKLKSWGVEAYNLNNEKRSHYIMDRYSLFLDANDSPELLGKLLDTRNSYDGLSADEGPYHTEVFPYHFYSPEEILLEKNGQTEYKKNLDGAIEDLIVELNMK
jgi:hypothetical protein